MSKIILQVEGLHTVFFTRQGVVKAVDGVSFYVREGETFGIVGESGCGKTVTGLSILRLLPEPAGRIVGGKIILDGKNLLELSKKEMREYRGSMISMILQDPMTSLNPVYTIGDQIAESVRLHQNLKDDAVEKEVISALRLLKIPAPEMRLHDYPFQMSGGMRQRVVGAIAMSCHPRLLIADEPTTALDATIQAQYIALFKDVQRQTNVAIVFITHDFGVVAQMCHRVGVMYAGKIVETATTRELFKAPRHPYTSALINSVPRLDRKDNRLYSIEGQPPSMTDLPRGCRFFPRCSVARDVCREQEPGEVDIGGEHSVSCWRVS
ncbi:MAG TPA: ABC transporter ATP-binding protein [Dehalococcoidales bacterium]|nr:MAG: dipeptide/oligopeptide/nickel ABC transporter ATP-binding protein [Chloroflexi bacterium RBG_16_60_22]HJX12038.1 ABC transporter ATP-binding protein [Dehalococcoidales bacterium]